MRNSGSRRRFISVHSLSWALATLLVVGGAKSAMAQPDAEPVPPDHPWAKANLTYEGTTNCIGCHQKLDPNRSSDLSLMVEYPIWKSHDKHAQAYAVLEGDRGKNIGKALNMNVTEEKAGCLNCHGMQFAKKRGGESVEVKDGVSCGGCHGPSSDWSGKHWKPDRVFPDKEHPGMMTNWKGLSPAEKHDYGLRDLRDPAERSTLCLSCHVGNAREGKVVTHAMFVAGHPPLPPIELATFARNEPQHWRHARDMPFLKGITDPKMKKNYHIEDMDYQQTKLALVGAVVAFRETMRLAHDRSTLKSSDAGAWWPELLQGKDALTPDQAKTLGADDLRSKLNGRWPDLALAHSDCYACHHDLQVPGFRQARGYGYKLSTYPVKGATPGRPVVRIWPTAMLEAAIMHSGKTERLKELQSKLDILTAACSSRPFGKPDEMAKATEELITWCDAVVSEVNAAPCTDESVKTLLKNLANLYVGQGMNPATIIPDFESARQIASVVKVAAQELRINGKAAGFEKQLEVLSDKLDIEPYQNRTKRIEITLDILSKKSEARDEFVKFVELLKHLDGKDSPAFNTAWQGMRTNDFLNQTNRLSNKEFNDAFNKRADDLQKLGDEEQTLVFKAVDEYDPKLFRENLKALIDKVTK